MYRSDNGLDVGRNLENFWFCCAWWCSK